MRAWLPAPWLVVPALVLCASQSRGAAPPEDAAAATAPTTATTAATTAAPPAAAEPQVQNAILVAVPFGPPAAQAAQAHKALVTALQAEIGPRVLDVTSVLDAQLKASSMASDLALSPPNKTGKTAPPPGLARLMSEAKAASALLVDVQDRQTVVYIFIGGSGPASPIVKMPRRKKDALDDKWAKKIAQTVKKRAGDALEAFEIEIDIGDASVADAEPADADIKAELAAEAAADKARADRLAREKRLAETGEPWATALLSGGGALRFLDVGGPGAASLAPLSNGVVPTVGAYVAVAPIRALVPTLRPSPFSDVTIEGEYRRGIWDVRDPASSLPGVAAAAAAGDGASCGYDDDDAWVRAGWRTSFVAHPWVPKVGVVAGVGYERVAFHCDVALPSTAYTSVGGALRVTQPLLPRADDNTGSILELDLVGGGRAALVPANEGSVAPGLDLEAFLVTRPIPSFPYAQARAGVAYSSSHVDVKEGGDVALAIDDARASFELQLGVVF